MKKVLWTLLISMFLVGIAFAAQDEEVAKGFDWNNLWQMALLGAFSTAILGKGKKGDFKINLKELKPIKMIQKGIVGLVIGIVASLKGISLAESQAFMFGGDALIIGTLITFGLDYLFRTVFKGAAITVGAIIKSAKSAANPPPPLNPS